MKMVGIVVLGLIALAGVGIFMFSKNGASGGPDVVDYVVKGNEVFWFRQKVEMADAASFQNLGMGYGKDKKNVYFMLDVLANVDTNKFRKINSDPNDFGFRDDLNAYLGGKKVEGADPKSMKAIGEGIYGDKNFVYWNSQTLKGIDVNSFKYLGLHYGKDKNKVYQFGSQGGASDGVLHIVEGADPNTFEVIPGAVGFGSAPNPVLAKTPDSRDKDNEFRDGEILKK